MAIESLLITENSQSHPMISSQMLACRQFCVDHLWHYMFTASCSVELSSSHSLYLEKENPNPAPRQPCFRRDNPPPRLHSHQLSRQTRYARLARLNHTLGSSTYLIPFFLTNLPSVPSEIILFNGIPKATISGIPTSLGLQGLIMLSSRTLRLSGSAALAATGIFSAGCFGWYDRKAWRKR